MTQKDKVKELVGRGLHSYHTKALQQIDRIEKKNKQQNHKISMLTNELDNDYLTKTEEGSVISLEHSKEGMVYLDELQGNTMVNYCTDGSKEMTLNGDIDLEGTFVTTTEGVDNGLVDVYCEGNTLVNCIKDASIKDVELIAIEGSTLVVSPYYALDKFLFKPNKTYTFIAFIKESTIDGRAELCCSHSNTVIKHSTNLTSPFSKDVIKFTFETKEDFGDAKLGFYHQIWGATTGKLAFTQMILEGDWTDKEIPPYFEGMKSVGQDDENGHKIEILSRNDNLFVPTQYIPNGWSNGNMIVNLTNFRSYWIECKPNTTYFIESDKSGNRFGVCCGDRIELNGVTFPVTKGGIYGSSDDTDKVQSTIFTTDATAKYLYVYTTNNGIFPTPKIMISEGSSVKAYIEPKFNKKEILLNEPLRGFEVGKKDRFIKIGDKCFIERSCILYDYSEYNWSVSNEEGDDFIRAFSSINEKLSSPITKCSTLMSFNIKQAIGYNPQKNGVWVWNTENDQNYIYISLEKTKLSSLNSDGIKEWCRNNSLFVLCQLATPTYEPLEIEPTLNTYNDVTHISNNSIIPCNMKIQNTGYNAIIKPSTLYTIALDTNKSGTIGMNLGGTKGTTTNNVLTLTTPATLTDDSLRLHGKGIKGSKVRLLEGDKTNWIPSHFEGMKSSFEDKFDASDNTYKMEILSNNENLFNENILEKVNSNYYEIINKDNRRCLKIERPSLMYRTRILNQLKKNTSYKINFDMLYDRTKGDGLAHGASIHIVYTDGTTSTCYASNSYNEWLNANITTPLNKTISYIQFSYGTNTPTYIDLDTFIIQENNNLVDYVYHKSNKIQFSSIEPLRGVGDVKDRFVFKDGKLMIERNIKSSIIDGTEGVVEIHGGNKCMITKFVSIMNNGIDYTPISCDKLQVYTGRDIMVSLKNVNGICYYYEPSGSRGDSIVIRNNLINQTVDSYKEFLLHNPLVLNYIIKEPTYEEIPFELQKIILEGYENGTLFFDTNIPPTITTTYAGETPIVSVIKSNKSNVVSNTQDINDNIIPYLMDMDYRVVCLQLATEEIEGGVSMTRLFGGTYEMLKRDIQSNRLTKEEYGYRLIDYFNAGKLTEEEVRELEDLR